MAVVESRDIFGRVSCAQGISEFWKEKSMQENRIDAFERKLDAGLVLSIVATGIMSFSGVCVETAMNVTFPTLMREFGVNTATVQWLTTAYLLVLAAVVPVSGFLNRRFKTKHVFCFAMAFYIAGIVCGMTAQVFRHYCWDVCSRESSRASRCHSCSISLPSRRPRSAWAL